MQREQVHDDGFLTVSERPRSALTALPMWSVALLRDLESRRRAWCKVMPMLEAPIMRLSTCMLQL